MELKPTLDTMRAPVFPTTREEPVAAVGGIHVQALRHGYGATPVLDELSLSLPAGSFSVIVGPWLRDLDPFHAPRFDEHHLPHALTSLSEDHGHRCWHDHPDSQLPLLPS